MNEDLSRSLIAEVQAVILSVFDVSPEEAQQQAIGLVALADGWGGDGGTDIDWPYTVKKRLGANLKWRSDVQRQKFISVRETVTRSYEQYIQQRKRA